MALEVSSRVKSNTAQRSVSIPQKEPDPDQAGQAAAWLFCMQISKLRTGEEGCGLICSQWKRGEKSSRNPISRTSVSHEKMRRVWGHGRETEGRADS